MYQSTQRKYVQFFKFLTLTFIVLIFFLPIISMIITSLKTRGELFVIPPIVIPKAPKWKNYIRAWTMVRFGHFLINSLIISTFYTLPVIISSSFAGYAFSRFKIRESKIFFLIVLSTMMIPQMVTVIPLYLLLSKLGLVGKRYLWLFFGLQGTPFLIFLFRQYFSTVPISFEESARLDGATRFQIYFYIMFPLVQTAVIISAIFAFQWSWADYLTPVLFLTSEKTTLAVKLATAYTDVKENVLHNIQMAGIFYYAAPIVIIFFALQKRFISGMLSGGLKG